MPGLNPIVLEKNKRFLKNQLNVAVEFSAPSEPALLEALARDARPTQDVELGKIKASASAGIPAIEFGGDSLGTVSFGGSAGVLSGLGIYLDRGRMLRSLQFDAGEDLQDALEALPNDATGYYAALRWGYDLAAQGAGRMALGAAGAIKFAGEAQREGLFAVIRRIPAETGMLAAATQAVNSWMLPRQVTAAADLEPRTWIVAEVDSGIALKTTGTLGYNFSWLRQLQLGSLGGDIGFKLQLGLEAVVGLTASGKYALVIARESEAPVLRLRLYKLRQKGWDFALNAGAAVDTIAELPSSIDDFIKAALGVHGAQIIKDLQAIESWTDPEKKPSQILSGLSEDYCLKLLERLTAIPVVNQGLGAFNRARDQVLAALRKWQELDQLAHGAATKILKILETKGGVDLTAVQKLAEAISKSNVDAFRKLLGEQLERSDFFQSNEGKWLESVLSAGVFSAFQEPAFGELQKAAALTSEILGGSAITGVITKLQSYVNEELNLDRIQSVIESADISHLEAWLKVKLEEFLAKRIDIPQLIAIQESIHRLLECRNSIYERALAAANRKYEFALHSTYKQATTDTALIDLEFDFAAAGAASALAGALRGDFSEILLRPPAGVRVHAGILSHGVRRESHIEVSLPYFSAQSDHIQESVAKFEAEESGGRIYVLDARDKASDKGKRVSVLSVGAYLPLGADDSVRRHSPQSLTYSYSYKEAVRGMRTAHLRYQLAPYVKTYFKPLFEGTSASYEVWIDDLDRTLDARGTHQIGNTLVSLELSLPGELTAAWFGAPINPKAAKYLDMSKRLQRAIKRLLPFYYLQDLDNYKDLASVYALLVYAAIPPLNKVRVKGGQLIESAGDYYWDWVDSALRLSVASSTPTQGNLMMLLTQSHSMLEAAGRKGDPYEPELTVLGSILQSVKPGNPGFQLLHSLLQFEADVVTGSVNAAIKLAGFAQSKETDAAKAIEALAGFGAAASETFNRELGGVYGRGPSRPLSTMLFIEAAAALDGRIRPESIAMLDLTVLTDSAAFPDGYLEGDSPKKEDILISQRLLNSL